MAQTYRTGAPAILYVVIDPRGWVCYSATNRAHARAWIKENQAGGHHRMFIYDQRMTRKGLKR